ncbi:PLAC8 family protein [Colletotrichum paranaense]|uniref:PLAC8 family protein n=3 Tax=Colletotrichum acutatum species complex TaxID=2707335 RepID=A0AAI9YNZ8_9PEZI|nr:PLAC8 family protein [Colletotrichum costaricense]XP_060351483.1 PLAC8 family protein [Colletotrichum paranaense]KAK0374613.1 PLAC8 family protein [Colletotrichum limetticola]KAK1518025.1 PLAC8 family protein [Colletotrichum costaricense]KAK1542354.1 PLAC8 family protein [Colletotrichum paranaense]
MPSQEWQSDLMDCSPCGTCMMASFLPCMVFGKTSERMRDPSLSDYSPINGDCFMISALGSIGLGWLFLMNKRGDIRKKFHIEGSTCGDCCVSFWCPCCVLIQHENEVEGRTDYGPINTGYQSQAQNMEMK